MSVSAAMNRRKHFNHLHLYQLFIALSTLFLAVSCEQESEAEKIKKAAQETVEASYQALLDSQYDRFLSYRAGSETLPDDYREQLITSYKQSMAIQQEEHGGIKSFQVSNVQIDSLQNLVQVFVMLNYADNVQEEILVPVVKSGEEWKMK